MKYLKKYNEVNSFDRVGFISSIIDEEIVKTKNFGLDISGEDIKIEKDFFNKIFEFYWDSIVDCRSNSEYSELRQFISEFINNNLLTLIKKYNELGIINSTKNMYSCHLDCCISTLMMMINNKQFK